jgi:hypothetical protein
MLLLHVVVIWECTPKLHSRYFHIAASTLCSFCAQFNLVERVSLVLISFIANSSQPYELQCFMLRINLISAGCDIQEIRRGYYFFCMILRINSNHYNFKRLRRFSVLSFVFSLSLESEFLNIVLMNQGHAVA